MSQCYYVLMISWSHSSGRPTGWRTYGFQCSLEILYRLPNMMGRTLSMFSSMRLRMYSLFQKYSARSATYRDRKNKGVLQSRLRLSHLTTPFLFNHRSEQSRKSKRSDEGEKKRPRQTCNMMAIAHVWSEKVIAGGRLWC